MRRPAQPAAEESEESDRYPDAPHPRETAALFGQSRAETVLLEAWRSGRLPHAWILGGPEGVGKATLAWRFARFVLAHPDPAAASAARDLAVDSGHAVARQIARLSHGNVALLRREWDGRAKKPFTAIRVDDVRAAQKLFQSASASEGYRIAIVDAADDLNANAANALLKLIEEPPARSLFLIVAHRPGLVTPTIRSRCARLMLEPLSETDVARAVAALGAPWSERERDEIEGAAARAGGSVRAALDLLDAEALAFARQIEALLAALPRVDAREAHRLADIVAPRGAEARFEALIGAALGWLDARVRAGAGEAARLAPYAAVWEKLRAAARDVETYNLDRRPLVLSIFRDLAAAERRARG
ncbi:MAG: DNA polymerase III subunit delta' [Methylobacteriaceae bacterium]|nr:DNA polymerase III subunit delta' [Methylobacteriaceae bacterium]